MLKSKSFQELSGSAKCVMQFIPFNSLLCGLVQHSDHEATNCGEHL